MERLSKVIAAAGVAARRKAAELVRAGRVRVDGKVVTQPGLPVDADKSRVEVDGRRVRPQPKRYLMLNKPCGPLSTAADQRGRPTVLDLLGDREERLYPAGRLDADTEGLLLITNDGDLTYRLTHPRHEVEKVYEAEVEGRPSEAALRKLEQGIRLDDGFTGTSRARLLRAGDESTLLELTVHAGRKRMVRRMLAAVGHPVVGLRRTRVGPLTLGKLRPGRHRALTEEEVAALKAYAERATASAEEAAAQNHN
jgi:23S rRNA pseudouridine2605 synthase